MSDLGFNQHLKDLGFNSVNDLFKRNILSNKNNIREMTPQEAKTKRNKKIRNKLAKLSKKEIESNIGA